MILGKVCSFAASAVNKSKTLALYEILFENYKWAFIHESDQSHYFQYNSKRSPYAARNPEIIDLLDFPLRTLLK